MKFKPESSWEFLSQDEIESRSIKAIKNNLASVKKVSPYYRELFADVNPEDIKDLGNFSKLPLTDKSTLVKQTENFVGVCEKDIVETVMTSGSTGSPLIFPMTANDVDRLAFNEALSFNAIGITNQDRLQLLVSLDRLFIAGMAYYRGASLLGANVFRMGVLPIDMQQHYITLLQPTVLVGVPSFLKKMGNQLSGIGFDLKNSSVQKLVCIGESIRARDMKLNAVGKALEELYGAKIYSTYGITELVAAYCECRAQCGNHCKPSLVYTEIVDDSGDPVPDESVGELVITTFNVEGLPLVRYKTGDITFKINKQCDCGRNSCRTGPVLGRKSQVIKIKGTTVYPLAVTNVIDSFDDIEDYVVLIENDASLCDKARICLACSPELVEDVEKKVQAAARVKFPAMLSSPEEIAQMRGSSRKKIRLIDKRKQPGK